MQLKEVNAIVTGGASGLGLSVATRIVNAGGKAAIFDLSVPQGRAAAAALGDRAAFFAVDVSDEAAVDSAVKQAAAKMGSVNAAINCAGIATPGRLVGRQGPMAGSSFRRMIEINLLGTVLVAKAAAVAMQTNTPNADGERGVIVMTASVAAFDGQIGQAAYSASKGGVVGMTLPMARELARFGIRVNTIAPGIFWTPMVDGMPPSVQESLSASIPFPSRLGRPEEFADTVAFIINSRYLNGETIPLDGAVRLAPK